MQFPELKQRMALKMEARAALAGKWGTAIAGLLVCYIYFGVLAAVINLISIQTAYKTLIGIVASIFLTAPVAMGFHRFYLKMSRGKTPEIKELFQPFAFYSLAIYTFLGWLIISAISGLITAIPDLIGVVSLHGFIRWPVEFLFTLLSSFFLLVARGLFGIVFYFANDNIELSAVEVYQKCYHYMKDHWANYIVLELSFLGWLILGMLSCGIGLLWVIPYMEVTMCKYYENLKQHIEGTEEPAFSEE